MPSVLLLGALMWPQVLPLRIGLHRRTRFFAMCVMTAVLIFFSAIRICAGFFFCSPALRRPLQVCPQALGSALSAPHMLCLPL